MSPQIMAEYTSLLSDLSENITNEDLEQLKSACKEDIPEDQSNNITSSKEWFSYLEKNDKLAHGEEPATRSHFFNQNTRCLCSHGRLAANHPSPADNLSYIEHIFEISRRPDLLTRVVEYRTTVLKISEDDEIDTKLTRIPSAKKYKGTAGGRLVRGPQDLKPPIPPSQTLPPGFPAAGLRFHPPPFKAQGKFS